MRVAGRVVGWGGENGVWCNILSHFVTLAPVVPFCSFSSQRRETGRASYGCLLIRFHPSMAAAGIGVRKRLSGFVFRGMAVDVDA